MKWIIEFSSEERKQLLKAYRSAGDARTSRRAHVLLLLAEGWTWQSIREALFCSNDLIQRTSQRFREGVFAIVKLGVVAKHMNPAIASKSLLEFFQVSHEQIGIPLGVGRNSFAKAA